MQVTDLSQAGQAPAAGPEATTAASVPPRDPAGFPAPDSHLGYGDAGLVIAAMAAIGIAASALVDATRAFRGGIANVGFKHIETCLQQFSPVLAAALGGEAWRDVFRAQWCNGVPKEEQKSKVRQLVRLGLSSSDPAAIETLAAIGRVDAKMLGAAVKSIEGGKEELTSQQNAALGRVQAAIAVLIDAAFERADQQYRNTARLAAGVVAVVLAVVGNWMMLPGEQIPLLFAVAVGVLAVPVAPVARDLISALSTTARSLKAIKGAI